MGLPYGLLVVQRYSSTREPSGGPTSFEVLERYRGFDGIAWPGELIHDVQLVDGLAPLDELDRLSDYVTRIAGPEIDLVYCTDGADIDLANFDFVGYDVGYYCSEYLHYSVILNEVLYGSAPGMVDYAKLLNAHLLFDAENQARDLLRVREALIHTDADLEHGEESLYVWSIFAFRRANVNARRDAYSK